MELKDLTEQQRYDLAWEVISEMYPTDDTGCTTDDITLEQLATSTTLLITRYDELEQIGNYTPKETEELTATTAFYKAFGFKTRLI